MNAGLWTRLASCRSVDATLSRGWLAACIFVFLAACELTPPGGSLARASDEIGNTYTLEWPRRVQVCNTFPSQNCFARDEGSFTIDNAVVLRDNWVVFMHLVFANGSSGWMLYNDFVKQQFAEPAKTRLVAKIGMTRDQIKATWGEPKDVSPELGNRPGETWYYPVIGSLHFKDGKLVELTLDWSLLNFN